MHAISTPFRSRECIHTYTVVLDPTSLHRVYKGAMHIDPVEVAGEAAVEPGEPAGAAGGGTGGIGRISKGVLQHCIRTRLRNLLRQVLLELLFGAL